MQRRDLERIDLIERCARRAYEVHMQAILANLPGYNRHSNEIEREAIAGAHNMLGSLGSIMSVCRSLRDHPGDKVEQVSCYHCKALTEPAHMYWHLQGCEEYQKLLEERNAPQD